MAGIGQRFGPSRRSPRDLITPAEAAEVDALDEQAVEAHLRSVVDKTGRVDISFNAVGIPDLEILGVQQYVTERVDDKKKKKKKKNVDVL